MPEQSSGRIEAVNIPRQQPKPVSTPNSGNRNMPKPPLKPTEPKVEDKIAAVVSAPPIPPRAAPMAEAAVVTELSLPGGVISSDTSDCSAVKEDVATVVDKVAAALGQASPADPPVLSANIASLMSQAVLLADLYKTMPQDEQTAKLAELQGRDSDLYTLTLNRLTSTDPSIELLGQSERMATWLLSAPPAVQESELESLRTSNLAVYVLVQRCLLNYREAAGAAVPEVEEMPAPAPSDDPMEEWLRLVLRALTDGMWHNVAYIRDVAGTQTMTRSLLDRSVAAGLVAKRQQGSSGVYSITDLGRARIR